MSDSQAWEIIGGFYAEGNLASGHLRGGSRPQTAEVIKNFHNRCGQVIVTMNPERADYVVLFDREGGKGLVRRDNKIAVFDWQGDAVFSGSTVTVGGAVKDACQAIVGHFQNATPRDGLEAVFSVPDCPSGPPPVRDAPGRRYGSSRDYDGFAWNALRREGKTALLAGYRSALEEVFYEMTTQFDLSASLPEPGGLMAASNHEQERRKAILGQPRSTTG